MRRRSRARISRRPFLPTAQNSLPVILKQRTVNLGNGRGYRYEDFASIDRAHQAVSERPRHQLPLPHRHATGRQDQGDVYSLSRFRS